MIACDFDASCGGCELSLPFEYCEPDASFEVVERLTASLNAFTILDGMPPSFCGGTFAPFTVPADPTPIFLCLSMFSIAKA
jgi:hypothetical protein